LYTIIFITALISLGIGLAIKIIDGRKFSWIEFTIGIGVSVFIIGPAVAHIGYSLSKNNLTEFSEYRNGWELSANKSMVECTRDGSCHYTYDCDPYTVVVPETSCDSKGTCHTTYHTETKYHDCPYSSEEDSYSIHTTLGDYNIASGVFPNNPQQHRYRDYEAIPASVISSAGVGSPNFWNAAYTRIKNGSPGPVAIRANYKNYILASDNTILKQYSNDISTYQKKGLLPSINSTIEDTYHARKVYFVGVPANNYWDWESRMQYLDSALGSERQGDAHLIIVNANMIDNPDNYILAVKSYWQDKKIFDKNTLAKNGILIVAGTTNGKTVSWMRATTGMPIGNQQLITAFQNVASIPLTPLAVIGNTYSKIDKGVVKTYHMNGAIENILWNNTTGFRRVSMSGKNGPGFKYLLDEIQPTTGGTILIYFIAILLDIVLWCMLIYISEQMVSSSNHSTTSHNNFL
jgi:hypothetical protein